MNILRSVALVGISTLLLGGCTSDLYAGPYDSAYPKYAEVYKAQPRVITVQPNRQSHSQPSRIYAQQAQVQQHNYHPGQQHQQPRHPQQWSQQYRYPSYGQQPRYDRHNQYGPPRDRWPQHQRPSQRSNEQYQRPDYRAQQQRYKEQRDYERETRNRNLDLMLRNAKPLPYQQAPQRNQHRNYGSGARR